MLSSAHNQQKIIKTKKNNNKKTTKPTSSSATRCSAPPLPLALFGRYRTPTFLLTTQLLSATKQTDTQQLQTHTQKKDEEPLYVRIPKEVSYSIKKKKEVRQNIASILEAEQAQKGQEGGWCKKHLHFFIGFHFLFVLQLSVVPTAAQLWEYPLTPHPLPPHSPRATTYLGENTLSIQRERVSTFPPSPPHTSAHDFVIVP